jgi:hypothetical protein
VSAEIAADLPSRFAGQHRHGKDGNNIAGTAVSVAGGMRLVISAIACCLHTLASPTADPSRRGKADAVFAPN